jgi:hypothetical protein
MKKTVLTWGLVTGTVSAAMMAASMPFMDRIGFDRGMIIGYTSLVLSALLVFFGVRSYRDGVAGGRLTFKQGFLAGLGIVVVWCLMYVAAWLVLYYNFMPDFLDKYTAYTIAKETAAGASPEKLAEIRAQAAEFARLYANPLVNAAFTFLEPFPIGLLAAIVSAAVLRRKEPGVGHV